MLVTDLPTNYLSAKYVQYSGYIDKLAVVRYVGKVTGPDIVSGYREVVSNEIGQYGIGHTGRSCTLWFLAPTSIGLYVVAMHDSQYPLLVNA